MCGCREGVPALAPHQRTHNASDGSTGGEGGDHPVWQSQTVGGDGVGGDGVGGDGVGVMG